jgi:RNA polymerase-binding transcription factor DksA
MSTQKTPVNNTPLTEDELKHFKKKLEQEKSETESTIQDLKDSLDSLNSTSDDVQSSQDHHQADLGTKENRKATILKEIERQTEKRDQIIVALDRMETGNYGICIDTGEPIQKERLEAIPYAIRSVVAKD